MKKFPIVFIILLIFSSIINISAKSNWELKLNKNGIKVYSREIKGSPYHEFKAVKIFNTKYEVLVEVLKDIEGSKNWVDKCKLVKVVKKYSDLEYTMYTAINFPAPVSDRDIVFRSKTSINTDKGVITINFKKENDEIYPRQKGHVRMEKYRGSYIIEYVNRNKTKMTYKFHLNPGGSIPAFILNSAMKDSPYKTFLNINKMLKKKKYLNRAFNPDESEKIIFIKILKSNLKKKISNNKFLSKILKDKKFIKLIKYHNGNDIELEKKIISYLKKHYPGSKRYITM